MSTGKGLTSVNETSQASFTQNHELYDAVRPSYADDVVNLVVQKSAGPKILEVAAGTGKFTAELIKKVPSSNIVALEPSPGMLSTFRKKFPSIETVQAASADIPFGDSSFDTIIIAQAFHWFANRESLAEFNRVLKPGGVLILVWNLEDFERIDPNGWQSKVTKYIRSFDVGVPQYHRMDWVKAFESSRDLFKPYEEEWFHSEQTVPSKEYLWQYWASRSYITAKSAQEQDEIRKHVLDLLKDHKGPLVAGRGTHVVFATPEK